MHVTFWLCNLKGRVYLEVLGVDGRQIFKWILHKLGVKSVDLIRVTQDRGQWGDLVNTVLNLPGPQKARNLLTS
jgi:hypothetical protein